MATTIVQRLVKGSALTWTEHDANHVNAANTADSALSTATSASSTATAAQSAATTAQSTASAAAATAGTANTNATAAAAAAAAAQATADSKLAASAGAVGTSNLADGSVTLVKQANLPTKTYIGRTSAGTGVPEGVAVATVITDLGVNLKAPIDSPSFTGPVTQVGASIVSPSAMGALSVDTSKEMNTKSINVDSTLTFSTTPGANTWFGVALTNSDTTTAHIVTIPSSYPEGSRLPITKVNVPAGATVYLTWRYDGTNFQIFGSGQPTGNLVKSYSANHTFDATDLNGVILHPAADTTPRTFTIDSNVNLPCDVGTWMTVDNEFGAGAITLQITTDTLEKVGTLGTAGTITIPSGCQATIYKCSATKWRASGIGI